MTVEELAKVCTWARAKSASRKEPLWASFLYQRLTETLDALLAGLTTTGTPREAKLRLAVSNLDEARDLPSGSEEFDKELNLISLAAWLHREAKQAEAAAQAAAEPDDANLSRQDAARLARASEIVKEAADRQRHEQAAAKPHPRVTPANQA